MRILLLYSRRPRGSDVKITGRGFPNLGRWPLLAYDCKLVPGPTVRQGQTSRRPAPPGGLSARTGNLSLHN